MKKNPEKQKKKSLFFSFFSIFQKKKKLFSLATTKALLLSSITTTHFQPPLRLRPASFGNPTTTIKFLYSSSSITINLFNNIIIINSTTHIPLSKTQIQQLRITHKFIMYRSKNKFFSSLFHLSKNNTTNLLVRALAFCFW